MQSNWSLSNIPRIFTSAYALQVYIASLWEQKQPPFQRLNSRMFLEYIRQTAPRCHLPRVSMLRAFVDTLWPSKDSLPRQYGVSSHPLVSTILFVDIETALGIL